MYEKKKQKKTTGTKKDTEVKQTPTEVKVDTYLRKGIRIELQRILTTLTEAKAILTEVKTILRSKRYCLGSKQLSSSKTI